MNNKTESNHDELLLVYKLQLVVKFRRNLFIYLNIIVPFIYFGCCYEEGGM